MFHDQAGQHADDAHTERTPENTRREDRSAFSPRSPFSPQPPSDDDQHSLSSSMASSSRTTIPDHWREETQTCIAERALDSDAQRDIVRTLVTLLVSRYGPKPGTTTYEQVAWSLILKYPFMADDVGTGYVSLNSCYTVKVCLLISAMGT